VSPVFWAFGSAIEVACVKELPSKSVLHNWLAKWDLSWLRNILSNIVAKIKPSLMAIDATGFDSFNRSRHYEKRLREFAWQIITYNLKKLSQETKVLLYLLYRASILDRA